MSAIKYVMPKTAADLDKVQDKAIRAANNARNLIQIALIATVHHLAINHDVRVARRLVDGLHETVRGKALVQFLTKYGCLTVGEVEVEDPITAKKSKITTFTGIVGNADEHNAKVREVFEEAKETMWWSLKPENPYKGFDLQTYLANGLAQVQKAAKLIEEGKAPPTALSTDVNDKTIRALLALVRFDTIGVPANGGEVIEGEFKVVEAA